MASNRYTSLLGISLNVGPGSARSLSATLMRRSGSGVQIKQALTVPFSLDPLTDDPELVGHEIRKHLTQAGLKERRCVVCLPLAWALSIHVDVPDLASDDLASFVEVQAEREFPFSPEDLSLSVSHYAMPSGSKGATIAAIPASHMTALEKAFKIARLKIVRYTFGVTSLLDSAGENEGRVSLLIDGGAMDMTVSLGGGILVLRRLEETPSETNEGEEPSLLKEGRHDATAEAVARQLRISLGRLPEEVSSTVRTVSLYGPSEVTGPVAEALNDRIHRAGLRVEEGKIEIGCEVLNESGAPQTQIREVAALAAAAKGLLEKNFDFTFTTRKKRQSKVLLGRTFSQRALWGAYAAIAIFFLCAAAIMYQKMKLGNLERQWEVIEPKVTQIQTLKDRIAELKPWFDSEPRSLEIARMITRAFPEEGTVWVTSLDIKALSEVAVSGKTTSSGDWEKMKENLLKTEGVTDLSVPQMRGDATGRNPVSFTFSFKWKAGATQ